MCVEPSCNTQEARLVVFGGNGFVGSHVCQAALQSGLQVLALSRSGTPAQGGGAWTSQVEWYKVLLVAGKCTPTFCFVWLMFLADGTYVW